MNKNVLIVNANYYNEVSSGLLKNAMKELSKKCKIDIINVPGVFEIPVTISKNLKKFDAFIAIGCVIKGKTPHFNYLCNSVFNSLLNLSIKNKKPLGNGILTCNNKNQALKRANPNKVDKGGDPAEAAISVLQIIKYV